ncbi:MAG: polysaccharide lyase [Acidimicrobiia bacterium]
MKPLIVALAVMLAVSVASLPAGAGVVVEDFGTIDGDSATPGYRGAGLEVVIPRGSHWGLGTFQPVPGVVDEAWFRYMVVFDRWAPSQSGKLPGLASLRSASARGCVPATAARPGWSARMMYRPVGASGAAADASRVGYYVYHLDQPNDCGEIMEWNDVGVLGPGSWHCIEGQVRLNRPGRSDGLLRGWVDGTEAFSRDGLRFRDSDRVGVDDLWLNVFSGGKSPSPERLDLRLDEVVVSTTGPVGCPDAFDDDVADPNQAAFNRLDALGVFPACGPNLACPTDAMSRAEFVSMLVGATGIAEGGPDAFADDAEHRFEGSIDAAAERGLTAGCGPDRFCPDDPMSRGAAAIMIVRAFDLPAVSNSVFDDVDDPTTAQASSALASALVAGGCGEGSFCPDAELTRSQAAAMLAAAVAQGRIEADPRGRAIRPSIEDVVARERPKPRQPS